jgi:hypothetical protein
VPPLKKRIVVVLDTNVVVGFYLSRNQTSPNAQVFRLYSALNSRKTHALVF